MSIQIGNATYSIPAAALTDAMQSLEQAPAAPRPGLGTADLTSVRGGPTPGIPGASVPAIPQTVAQTQQVPTGLTDKLGAASDITDIYSVMALFQQISQEARGSAREQRHAEMELRMESLGKAADEMREAALKRLIGTCVQAGVQAASGAFKIGMGSAGIKDAMKADKFAQAATKAGSETVEGAALATRAASVNAAGQARQMVGNGVADIMGAVGTVVKGGLDYSAGLDDAEKLNHDKQTELHRAAYDRANETMQQMMDVMRDIRSKLSEIENSANDTAKQITRA
jgi:hypothetical protein